MNKVIKMPKKTKSNCLYQQTIKNEIHCNGVGLHSGKDINMKFLPAKANTGIVFVRTDMEEGKGLIKASWDNVVDTKLCTVVANSYGASVGTVEHIMSAIRGCGIDNLIIEIDGIEVPIMDGSAEPFIYLFEQSGIEVQSAKRKAIKLLKEVIVDEGNKAVTMSPADITSFSFDIEFPSKAVGKQNRNINFAEDAYKSDISKARTFGFMKDVEMLKSMGLALGGSLDNAVVIEDDKILNEGGLRYKDEFVRHKILDAVGDLFLAGAPIIGHFHGVKSGHDLNNKILRAIFSDPTSWKMVDMTAADENAATMSLRVAM